MEWLQEIKIILTIFERNPSYINESLNKNYYGNKN
jgi:hypothetical protein